MRGVDGADLERAADFVEQLSGRYAAQRQRRHPAVAAGTLLMPAARHDNPRCIRQRQGAGAPTRRDLADAVADMAGRLDPEAAQHLDDPDLDGEEQRLRNIGVNQLLSLDAALDHLGDRPPERRAQRRIGLRDSSAKRCAGMIGLLAHPGPLRAVPRKHEGKFAVAHGSPGDHRRAVGAGDEIGERCDCFALILAQRDQALRMLVAPPRDGTQQGRRILTSSAPAPATRPRSAPK